MGSSTSASIPKYNHRKLTLLEEIEVDDSVGAYDFDLSTFTGIFDGFIFTFKRLNFSEPAQLTIIGSDDGGSSFENFRYLGNIYAYTSLSYSTMSTFGRYNAEIEIVDFERGVNGCYIRINKLNYNATDVNVYDENSVNDTMQVTGNALNFLRLVANTGNFKSGSIKFYGVKYDK